MILQVRDYIAARSSHPSGTQVPAQGGEVETQALPSEPSLDDGSQRELIQDIGDLDNDQLWEVLEALHMEIARREGAASQHRLPLGSLSVPSGGKMAGMDDREVTFWGGGDGNQARLCSSLQVPLGQCRCHPPPQHAHSWAEDGYPRDQHL